ncbi:MAG: isochorismate synthase [Actinomycetota bacterium]|nr:isochorismate synthase [Actinomycetota bacterium]
MTAHLVRSTAAEEPFDLLGSVPGGSGPVWLHQGGGLVGIGEAARFEIAPGPGRFERAQAVLASFFSSCKVHDEVRRLGSGPVAFGAFTFDRDAPGSALVVPQVVLGLREGRAWVTRIDGAAAARVKVPAPPAAAAERIRYAGSTMSELRWLEIVDEAVSAIAAGRLDKVVLARDLLVWSKSDFDLRLLAGRLAARYPQCFTFAFDGLIGATPELLVRRWGTDIESLVLAGSAARGHDEEADRALGGDLLHSLKDLDEHRPAVESVRSILNEVCTDLRSDPEPHLLKLANVQHLATRLQGRLASPASALELAGRLHPTAAICGTPTSAALELIHSLEGMERARYSGPVGWVSASGDGEWGIALRCAELNGGRGRLFAGSGIVRESLPEAELEETRLKLRAMQAALEG